ncbi:unnamed protein product [Peronospora destructor]|uniref:RxLR effector protein n=1 Tax=Peronospora destructor TaxID=86335 RepID=A0AAV0UKA3_9STRA|nr:unnamed protein product [Peronospora destructor]
MMLSVKKTFGLMLCASTFAAAETTRASALRTHPRRVLASGIHHSVKYTPNVVKQTKEPENSDSEEGSYDSYGVSDSKTTDVELSSSEEMVLDTVDEDVDLYTDNSIDADVNLKNDEVMDIEADSDQEVDISTNSNLDASVTGSLDATHQLDSDIDFMKGEVEVELEDGEAYEQNLDMGSDEVLDEFLDIPEGAKSIHLRMHKGNVDLDIIKNDIKKDAPHKEEKPKEEKKEEKAPATETKEATVSYAAEAKSWIQNNVTKAPILGSFIGAAVGVVGLAVVAIAKSRKRASEKSAEDMSVNADGEVEEDAASEADSDEDSDEDVEAGVTALTEEDAVEEDAVEEDAVEEDAVEEKKASIVEGSV